MRSVKQLRVNLHFLVGDFFTFGGKWQGALFDINCFACIPKICVNNKGII